MKYYLGILIVSLFFVGCSRNEKSATKPESKKPVESLIDIRNDIYTEYYPGKKQIKFQGGQDVNNQRNGKWVFYSPEGLELSTTHYEHGIKHGASAVKYPNGMMHYYGEYENDKQIGVWRTFDLKGNLVQEKDFSKK